MFLLFLKSESSSFLCTIEIKWKWQGFQNASEKCFVIFYYIFRYIGTVDHSVETFCFQRSFAKFCEMNNTGRAVRMKFSRALGPGSNPPWAIFFHEYTDICLKFEWFPWHSGRVLERWVRARNPIFTHVF